MDAKLELAVLLAFAVIGQSAFARFAGETPAWRKILKWTALTALTLALYRFAGHWSLALPLGFVVIGMPIHFAWCRRNGIHPFRATPARRYYQLRGWEWPGEEPEVPQTVAIVER